jgi:hypothetical protein
MRTASVDDDLLTEFHDICEGLWQTFSTIGVGNTDFEIMEKMEGHCSIAVFIKNYESIRPKAVESILPRIQRLLEKRRYFWFVAIKVYKREKLFPDDDTCIWLEIDQYAVNPFRGKKQIELFEEMQHFYRHFWTEGQS